MASRESGKKCPEKSSGEERRDEAEKGNDRSGNSLSATQRTATIKLLEEELWFHGMLPREEIKKSLMKDGDFLVRASTTGEQMRIVISARSRGDIRHFPLVKRSKGWRLEDKNVRFETVTELVNHYYMNKKALTLKTGVRITRGIRRPSWFILAYDVVTDKELGSGQFGEVLRGRLKRGEKRIPVAIKRCKGATNEMERDALIGEAKMMLSYDHENVVKIHGVAASKPPVELVMELCRGGALGDYLKKKREENNPVGLQKKKRFCWETAKGMEYLASKGCIHRDLAVRNCLLSKHLQVKISDFGMSKTGTRWKLQEGEKIAVRWSAPEVLEEGHFSSASDVFSFGVVVWEIFTDAALPWGEMIGSVIRLELNEGRRLEIPNGTPEEIASLMQACWRAEPSVRPTFKVIQEGLGKQPN